jgi:hypothetical protein
MTEKGAHADAERRAESMLRSNGFIACSLEEVVAFLIGEEIADMPGGAP